MELLERKNREPAREYALRVLKHNIVILDLAPGSIVSENELATEMSLSRTPVREALQELSKVQIVEIFPQKGSYIAKIDYNLVEEARFMRVVLEIAIVEQACEVADETDLEGLSEILKLQRFYLDNPEKLLDLDDDFHKQLFHICNKQRIYSLMENMMIHFDRVRSMSLSTVKDIKIVEDHHAILDAIKNRDNARAREAIQKHLSRYKIDEEVIRHSHPEYFK